MKIKKEQLAMLRLISMALVAALIALNNHWTITMAFIYLLFTLEIQGKILADLLHDMLKVIGELNKIKDSRLDKE